MQMEQGANVSMEAIRASRASRANIGAGLVPRARASLLSSNASGSFLGDALNPQSLSRERLSVAGTTGDAEAAAARRLAIRKYIVLSVFVGTVITFFAIAVPIWVNLEGWTPAECVYFLVVAVTTVGYGDYAPKHATSRFLLCMFLPVALVLFACSLGVLFDRIVAVEDKVKTRFRRLFNMRARTDDSLWGSGNEARRTFRRRFWETVAMLGVWILLGTLISRLWIGFPNWNDSLYFAVITLTTTGFGDMVESDKLFASSILCLVGVPLFGRSLAHIGGLVYSEGAQSKLDLSQVEGGLTLQRLATLQSFCQTLSATGAYDPEREGGVRKVSPFEFLSFMLVRSGAVTVDDIATAMKGFREMDVGGTGFLEWEDLEVLAQQRAEADAGGATASGGGNTARVAFAEEARTASEASSSSTSSEEHEPVPAEQGRT